MSHRTSVHDLERLVLSFHPLIAIETGEEERVEAIVRDVAGELRQPLYTWSVTTGLRRGSMFPIDGTGDAISVLQFILDARGDDAIFLLKDLGPHTTNVSVNRALREAAQKLTSTRSAIILTGDPLELPRDIQSQAAWFNIQLPDQDEMLAMVRNVVDALSARQRVQVELSRDEARQLVRSLAGLTLAQARRTIAQAIVVDGKLTAADIDRVIQSKGEIIERSGILEFFPLTENSYELGGFSQMKRWLEQASVGFGPEARALNLDPPKGVLLCGVQGCGKSLAAKVIARDWKLPLLRLDASRLYDKYVGETEKRFRKAIELAEAMAPVVLWIDEIEKMFGSVGSNDSDGGLSKRVFGLFLTWLQEKAPGVFVVAAANDVMSLPPELLRKGRFDEIFFVDLPKHEERKAILSIHLRLRKQDITRFDLETIAEATEGFSGAEIEQAVISSLYRALHAREELRTPHLLEAISSTVPLSVTRKEEIDALREMAATRFMPAG